MWHYTPASRWFHSTTSYWGTFIWGQRGEVLAQVRGISADLRVVYMVNSTAAV
jgi:hypothetical protein